MKKILTMATLVIMAGCAGGLELLPLEERQLIIVQETPGISKNEIFDKAIVWIATSFIDSKEVLEIQDREAGKIIGKGIIRFSLGMGVIAASRFTITIDIKDERYRVKFEDLVRVDLGENIPLSTVGYRSYSEQIFGLLQKQADKLHTHIIGSDDEDW